MGDLSEEDGTRIDGGGGRRRKGHVRGEGRLNSTNHGQLKVTLAGRDA